MRPNPKQTTKLGLKNHPYPRNTNNSSSAQRVRKTQPQPPPELHPDPPQGFQDADKTTNPATMDSSSNGDGNQHPRSRIRRLGLGFRAVTAVKLSAFDGVVEKQR